MKSDERHIFHALEVNVRCAFNGENVWVCTQTVTSGSNALSLTCDQLPQPSDHVLTVLKAGETVDQTGEVSKTPLKYTTNYQKHP